MGEDGARFDRTVLSLLRDRSICKLRIITVIYNNHFSGSLLGPDPLLMPKGMLTFSLPSELRMLLPSQLVALLCLWWGLVFAATLPFPWAGKVTRSLCLGFLPRFFPGVLFCLSLILEAGSWYFLVDTAPMDVRNQFWEWVFSIWYFTPLSELNSLKHKRQRYFPIESSPLLQLARWAFRPDTLE